VFVSERLIDTLIPAIDTQGGRVVLVVPQARSRALPGKLVRIGSPGTSLNPCLVETNQLPLSTEYIALSHCWGTETFYCLRKSNLY